VVGSRLWHNLNPQKNEGPVSLLGSRVFSFSSVILLKVTGEEEPKPLMGRR
jgi:hypothetical protein